MASENETIAEIVKRVRRDCNSYPIPTAAVEMLKLVREFEAAHRREVAELKTAYDRAVSADAHHAVENERLKGEVAELREYLKANTVGVKAMHEEIETLRGMITDLRAKLKIAEDALEKCKKCGWVECDTIANALAAIREEGAVK